MEYPFKGKKAPSMCPTALRHAVLESELLTKQFHDALGSAGTPFLLMTYELGLSLMWKRLPQKAAAAFAESVARGQGRGPDAGLLRGPEGRRGGGRGRRGRSGAYASGRAVLLARSGRPFKRSRKR